MRSYKLAGEDNFDPIAVLEAVRSVLPKRRPIGHHEPQINGTEATYVRSCLNSGVVGYDYVDRFEAALAARVGVDYCVATSSGTAALHASLLSCGVKPNDEVIVPTLTFAATANAVVFAGATPNFVDGALGINAYKLQRYLDRTTSASPNRRGRINKDTGRTITTIVPVHLLGSPVDPRVFEIASAYGLEVIEDAAEALGTTSGNRHCGTNGLAGVISFNNNKIVTTNGGGAILTNDEWIAAKCRQLVSTARIPHPWLIEHDAIGFNYSMGNINAALGLAQLGQLDAFLESKRQLAAKYRRCLDDCRGIQFLEPDAGSNNWLNAVMVDPRWTGGRDKILRELHEDGLRARCIFSCLHTMHHFADYPRDENMMYAEDAHRRMICLPSGAGLVNDLQT